MKKVLLTIVLTVSVVVAASFNAQIRHYIRPEKTISKNINLQIHTGRAYGTSTYAQSVAKLHFTVYKFRGTKSTELLQNSYPEFRLNRLYNGRKVLNQNITIPYVVDGKERIVISYVIAYKTGGQVLEVHNHLNVPGGTGTDTLFIKI